MVTDNQTDVTDGMQTGPDLIDFGVLPPHRSANQTFTIANVRSDALLTAHIDDDDSNGRFRIVALNSYSITPGMDAEESGQPVRLTAVESTDGTKPLQVHAGETVEIALQFFSLGPQAREKYSADLVVKDTSAKNRWQPIMARMIAQVAHVRLIFPEALQLVPGRRIRVPITAVSEAGPDTDVSLTLHPEARGIRSEAVQLSIRRGERVKADVEIDAAADASLETTSIRFDSSAFDGKQIRPVDVPVTVNTPLVPSLETCEKLENLSGPLSRDDQTWSNWGILDLPETFLGFMETPKLFQPTNPYEIAQAIRQTEAVNRTIRARGSGWSFSDAVFPQSSPIVGGERSTVAQLRTWALSRFVDEALLEDFAENFSSHFGHAVDTASINGSLQTLIGKVLADDHDSASYFLVEAGMTISDLNLLLDAQTPPVALKTMGGASGQSIAGAISTGTHGGDFDRPLLADNVRAMYLVGMGGAHHWVEPNDRITDPLKVQTTFPCIAAENIHYDDEMFQAALVSMGAMGVIYAVILDVVPQYSLLQWNKWSTWEELKREIGGRYFEGLFDGSWTELDRYLRKHFPMDNLANRFAQVVVNPIRNNKGEHNCYVTNRVELSLREPRGEPPIRDYDDLEEDEIWDAIYASPNVGHHEEFHLDLARHFGGDNRTPLIRSVEALLRFCKERNYPWAVRAVIDRFMQRSYPDSVTSQDPYVDVGHKVMASDRTDRAFATLDGSAVEAAFSFYKRVNREEGAVVPDAVTFVDSVLDAFDRAVDSDEKLFPAGYLSLRVCGQTEALLGMERFDRNGMVEVVLISRPDGHKLVRQVEQLARDQGAALHWGQSNGLMEFVDLAFAYGNSRIERWRAVQRQLGGDTFTNYFMERCGLVGGGQVPGPALVVNRTNLGFGRVPVGDVSYPQELRISNEGGADLVVSLSDPTTRIFTWLGFRDVVIRPRGVVIVQVEFAPQTAAPATGTLTLESDAPGSPHSVTLSGEGTEERTPL